MEMENGTNSSLKMILFDGTLAFSPNTLNNTLFAYVLAKKWEELNYTQDRWMKLINNMFEFNTDLREMFLLPNKKNVMQNTLAVFNDWDINGDGSVFSSFTAKGIFDSEQEQPLIALDEADQFPVSSPMGFHKAIIADQDTDSQMMSKIFAYQLVIKDTLSINFQPTSFKNITKKFTSTNPTSFDSASSADWFTKGKMKELSHKSDIDYKSKVLNFFSRVAREQDRGDKTKLINNFILRMNQFNYNHQTKMTFISGFINHSEIADGISCAHWRQVIFAFENNGGKSKRIIFLKQIIGKNGVPGLLIDANHISQVRERQKDFVYNDIQLEINCDKTTNDKYPGFDRKPIIVKLTGKQISKFCGMAYVKNAKLTESPAHIKATFINVPTDRKQDIILTGVQLQFTFQIEEIFKKSEFDITKAKDWNVQIFQPYILYDFRITRFGKNIPKQMIQQLDIALEITSPISNSNVVNNYAKDGAKKILEEVLKDKYSPFTKKYGSIQKIKKQVYLDVYDIIVDVASDFQEKTRFIQENKQGKKRTIQAYLCSKGIPFTTQFVQASDQSPQKSNLSVKIDEYGRGQFKVYLNENLTQQNNPRSFKGSKNPIISSLCLTSTITAKIRNRSHKNIINSPSEDTITSIDNISGIYYESNPSKGHQCPDWKNIIGPKLRVVGLMYPVMQNILNLYSFNQLNLDSMKRCFDIQNQLNARYMPSTRQMSPFQHRMIRRWLYQPYYDHQNCTNFNFKKIFQKIQAVGTFKPDFATKKKLLRDMLKTAFAFQLFTIPLYITAAFSSQSNRHKHVIGKVFRDQMKHLAIASNLINSIREDEESGSREGPPYLDPHYVPKYPSSPLYVYKSNNEKIKNIYTFDILPFSDEVLLKMIAAQFPSQSKNMVFSHQGLSFAARKKINNVNDLIETINKEIDTNHQFVTIGELYAQIIELLWQLSDEEDPKNGKVLFSGNPVYQFTYFQLQHMQEINGLRTALNQIKLITQQGEGSRIFDVKNQLKKLSHFLKFIELYTSCQVDIQKTHTLNDPYKDSHFTIYLKQVVIPLDRPCNKWDEKQDAQLKDIIEQQKSGTKLSGNSKYTNTYSYEVFTNIHKKLFTELHYIYNTSLSDFRQYKQKDKEQPIMNDAQLINEFKLWRLRRMQNSIASMKRMTIHSSYVIRDSPLPSYETKAPTNVSPEQQNQGKSLKPNFNVEVQYPNH